MKTIFTLALFTLLSVGSACSKSTTPINITGDWTLTIVGSGSASVTIKPDGTIDNPTLGIGTWVLKTKHFSATFVDNQLDGDIINTSPLKIEGKMTYPGGTVPFTLTKP